MVILLVGGEGHGKDFSVAERPPPIVQRPIIPNRRVWRIDEPPEFNQHYTLETYKLTTVKARQATYLLYVLSEWTDDQLALWLNSSEGFLFLRQSQKIPSTYSDFRWQDT